jgi:sporulation protein YlmC with PRC-barrel domain
VSDVEANETRDLISSDKVEGTSVYDRNGNKLGTVSNVMLDKLYGQVAYAVLSFGGFLGMGSSYYRVPWDQLTYDPNQSGYVVDLTKEQLERAPTFSASEGARWGDPAYGRKIDAYYSSVEGRSPVEGWR